MNNERYYELLKEAYVHMRARWPELRVTHMNNHTFHELLWRTFNHERILEQLEDEYNA